MILKENASLCRLSVYFALNENACATRRLQILTLILIKGLTKIN